MEFIDKKRLKKYIRCLLTKDCTLKISTFKRDRTIIVTKDNNLYTVLENGFNYESNSFLTKNETIKAVMKLAKIEFKNSHKLFISISYKNEECK